MTSFPMQLKHFIDDTLIQLLSKKLPLTPQQSTIDGVIKKVNTVRQCFLAGLIETSTHYAIVLKE